MSSSLFDHVHDDPTNVRRLVSPVLTQWSSRQWGCRDHCLGLSTLVAVESDYLRRWIVCCEYHRLGIIRRLSFGDVACQRRLLARPRRLETSATRRRLGARASLPASSLWVLRTRASPTRQVPRRSPELLPSGLRKKSKSISSMAWRSSPTTSTLLFVWTSLPRARNSLLPVTRCLRRSGRHFMPKARSARRKLSKTVRTTGPTRVINIGL